MYIRAEDVRAALSYGALIPAIRQALIDYTAGNVEQPPRTILRSGNEKDAGWFAVMPVIAGEYIAVKTVTFYPSNVRLGLHTHMAVVELLRRSTGEPLALMDGTIITEMRTAAVSAVAFAALAPPEARSLGILGSGVQARSHIAALHTVWPALQEIRIWSRTAANAQRLASKCGGRAVAIDEAAGADVVLTATNSPVPVLEGNLLGPDALVLAVGATGAMLRELDDEAMLSSAVIAESRAAVEREAGDVRLSGTTIEAEIGEILDGTINAPKGRRIVFKSVGMAIEDLTAARLVWEAREACPGDPLL
jgi:thiomorpholine-carboxylate dehydrogenase